MKKLEKLTLEDAEFIYKQARIGREQKFYAKVFKENGIEKIGKSLIYFFMVKNPQEKDFIM